MLIFLSTWFIFTGCSSSGIAILLKQLAPVGTFCHTFKPGCNRPRWSMHQKFKTVLPIKIFLCLTVPKSSADQELRCLPLWTPDLQQDPTDFKIPVLSSLFQSTPLSSSTCSFLASFSPSLRGHPFMTSTRRGRGLGSGGRMWTGGGGPAPCCGCPHRKLKWVHWRHTVYFSCKEFGVFFTRISSLDRKKWKFFCDIN